jgi:hypothetical protein
MTRAEQKLADAMFAALASGAWVQLSGNAIAWESEPVEVAGDLVPPFRRRVIVTFYPKPVELRLLQVDRAPGATSELSKITLRRAHEVLADPGSVFAEARTDRAA